MKKGLVLEGGGMRGMFTAGVLDVLMENNIEFDGVVGVSAGAAFGCSYISKQIGRSLRYNLKYCKDKRYCGMRSLIKTGDIFGAEFCYHEIPDKLDIYDVDTAKNNPTEFYVVCTDIETGKPVYKKLTEFDYNDLEWMRASASMPLVSRVVEIDGKKLLDGGMSDSIPLQFMEKKGFEKNVVVLTQPKNYVKSKSSKMGLIKMSMRKYPNMIKAMEIRHNMYNAQTAYVKEQEKNGDAFVIRPECPLEIDRIEHNAENLKRVYNIGRENMEKNLEKLKNFLQ